MPNTKQSFHWSIWCDITFHRGRHACFWRCFELLSVEGLLMEGSYEVTKSRVWCCFNSVHSSRSLFSSLAESKKVRNQRDPNQDRKCGLICCVPVPCQSSGCSVCTRLGSLRGPRKARNPQSNTTRARLFLNSLRRFTSHNTTFTQPNSFCGFCPLSKYLGTKSECFLGTARFRQAEHNDIFRDRPWLSKMQCLWQMSQSTIT